MRRYAVSIWTILLSGLVACATDTVRDKAEPFDASTDTLADSPVDSPQDVEDAATDTIAATGGVGRACAADRSCEAGDICINASKQVDMPGGYCSRPCSQAAECGESAVCASFLGFSMCMRTCASDGDCRGGYACENEFAQNPAPTGSRLCVPGRRLASVGGPCASLFDCEPGNGVCMENLLDGYCTRWCDPTSAGSCGANAKCIWNGPSDEDGLCFQSCEKDDDCRGGHGYQCALDGTCRPGTRTATVGQTCQYDNDCQAELGTCLTPQGDGIPNGYCSQFCDLQSQDSCGSDSECVSIREDLALCAARCPDMGDCRSGFECTQGFMGLPTQSFVCAPGQAADTPIGHDCTSASDCKAGSQTCLPPSLTRSLKEGYCSAICDGNYAGSACPIGSICVTNVFSSVGVCFAECTTDQECQARRSPTSTTNYGCSIRLGMGARVPDGKMACVAYNPYARIGDTCIDGSDCGSGLGRCIFDNTPLAFPRFPNGYCTLDCNPNSPTDTCGDGAVCHNVKKGSSLGGSCVKACTADTDCRSFEGYTCQKTSTGSMGCLPKS